MRLGGAGGKRYIKDFSPAVFLYLCMFGRLSNGGIITYLHRLSLSYVLYLSPNCPQYISSLSYILKKSSCDCVQSMIRS